MTLATNWRLPPDALLPPPESITLPLGDLYKRLREALQQLELQAEITKVIPGPSTVAFELKPGKDVRMRDFTKMGRKDDLAFALQAETVRIQAPIPGKQLVGIEIPAAKRRVVALSELLPVIQPPLKVGLGIAPDLTPVALDIAELPHLLIAGATKSGKSSLLHTIICSLLMRATPDELRLVLVDLKRTELGRYALVPHVDRSVDDAVAALYTLDDLVKEVERREKVLAANGAQDLVSYNGVESLPRILCVVDEFAELMLTAKKDVETDIVRLGQLGRACGVHLILATQSPHANICSGLIKANILTRVALRVASATHSRVAIDQGGAEDLLGKGDALLSDGSSVQRFQSAYVPAATIAQIVNYWADQRVLETVPDPVPKPVPSRAPTPSPPVRRRRGWGLGVLAAVALVVALSGGVAPSGTDTNRQCPSGASYENTGLREVCNRPNQTVACVLSSAGESPNPGGNGVDTYAENPGGGPWCENAHNPPDGTP